MRVLVGGDRLLRLQRDRDLVVAAEQPVLGLLVDLEADHSAGGVDRLVVEVDPRPSGLGDRAAVLARKDHRQEAVLGRVRIEDVRERGRDHGLEAEVGQRPDGVLARRSRSEVRPGDEHRVRLELDLAVADPVVEEELAEAGPLDPLQELLGDDLVGVDVGSVEHRHVPLDHVDRPHRAPPSVVVSQWRMSTNLPLDRGSGGHPRADQVRPPALALPALEVPVRGRGAALALDQDVGVHAEAHRAAGGAPLEAGRAEDLVEALLLGLRWRTCSEPGTTIARTALGDLAAVDHRGGGAEVLDPRVRAGADEDAVELDLGDRRAGLERHVGERPLRGLASTGPSSAAGSGTAPRPR